MFSDFLNRKTTYATELRDFQEWHKGIEHFGFWAIETTGSDCLEKIHSHQEYLSHRLHPGYQRQPHITLALEGLLKDTPSLAPSIIRTIEQLEAANLRPFPLQLARCNSFATCPYLEIADPRGYLSSIRNCLNTVEHQQNPKPYTPHVTLGFYNQAHSTSCIVKEMSGIHSPDIEFMVNEIVFAQYKTREVQGPYEVLHRIKLAPQKTGTPG